jgi:hypothetical protein
MSLKIRALLEASLGILSDKCFIGPQIGGSSLSPTHPPTHAPTTPVFKVRVRQKNSLMTEMKIKNLQSRQGLGFRVLEFEAIWCVVHNATCVSIGRVEYNHVSVKLRKGDGSVIIISNF